MRGQARRSGAIFGGGAARWYRGRTPAQSHPYHGWRGFMGIAEETCRVLANHPFGGGVCICWCEKARRGEARRSDGCWGCGSVRPAQLCYRCHRSSCQPIHRPCRRAPLRLRHMERKTAIHDLHQPVVSGRFRSGRSGRDRSSSIRPKCAATTVTASGCAGGSEQDCSGFAGLAPLLRPGKFIAGQAQSRSFRPFLPKRLARHHRGRFSPAPHSIA